MILLDQAYRLGANSFLVRPGNLRELSELMDRVTRYGLENPQLMADS